MDKIFNDEYQYSEYIFISDILVEEIKYGISK